MHRYHFHTADGSLFRDTDGEILPNLETAKNAALDVLVEALPSKRDDFWRTKMFSVQVKDDAGRLVAVLTTTATLDPADRPDVPPEG